MRVRAAAWWPREWVQKQQHSCSKYVWAAEIKCISITTKVNLSLCFKDSSRWLIWFGAAQKFVSTQKVKYELLMSSLQLSMSFLTGNWVKVSTSWLVLCDFSSHLSCPALTVLQLSLASYKASASCVMYCLVKLHKGTLTPLSLGVRAVQGQLSCPSRSQLEENFLQHVCCWRAKRASIANSFVFLWQWPKTCQSDSWMAEHVECNCKVLDYPQKPVAGNENRGHMV